MRVTIILITYNDENFVRQTISSVLNQTLVEWNAVIVDNGSTDRTFETAFEMVGTDERFQLFKKANEGPASGRNFGYGKISKDTDYLHFLDGDDALEPTYLETLLDYMLHHPEVGLCACQFLEIDKEGILVGKGHRSRMAPGWLGIPRDLPLDHYPTPFETFFAATGQGPFGMYKNDIFSQTGGYALGFHHEDTDMFCKMRLKAEVHYLPYYLYKKRAHEQNLSKQGINKNSYGQFREKWDMYLAQNELENQLIERSLKYYYTRHKPFRDLKVSAQSFLHFIRTFNFSRARWGFICLADGVRDLLFQTSYKNIMRMRQRRAHASSESVKPTTL